MEDDAYLQTLVRYVWNNPVDAGLAQRPEDYPWSSRHLVRVASPLIDHHELERLLPGGLQEFADAPRATGLDVPPELVEGPQRCSDRQAAELLQRICGAPGRGQFARLGPASQQRVVAELRTRSLPYAQIAAITGLSTSTVRRIHIAGGR